MALTKISYSMVTGAPFNVLDYGADLTGVADSRAACQAAIDAAKAIGASVYFPAGTYLIRSTTGPDSKNNGLVIPFTDANSTSNRVSLIGDGASTVLKAGDNNMIVARFSDSHCSMQGFSIDGNSKTSVWALGLVPQDMTQTSTVTFQLYNEFTDIYITGCDEGIAMRCGPDVAGTDSGCWYNSFINVFIIFTKRGIYLMDCPVGSSGVNRNYFTNMRIGQQVNTGVQIDDGSTNVFTKVHMEGVQTGISPNATPTAIKIKQTGASSADNNTNIFFGCVLEANTRSLDNANAYSEFYGCSFGAPYSMVLTQNPKVMIGDEPSLVPQFVPGFLYQTNSELPSFNNGITFSTTTGTAGVLLDATIKTTLSFQEKSGSSGNIANAATFVVTIPTPKRPQLLFVYSGTNLQTSGVYFLCGDGVLNVAVATITASVAIAVAGSAGNQVTITNNFGVTSNLLYTLTPFGVGV